MSNFMFFYICKKYQVSTDYFEQTEILYKVIFRKNNFFIKRENLCSYNKKSSSFVKYTISYRKKENDTLIDLLTK